MSERDGRGLGVAGIIAGVAAVALGGGALYKASKKPKYIKSEDEDYPELNDWYHNTGDEDEE